MQPVDIDTATLNDLAKNLRKAIQKAFTNSKADRAILDSLKNTLEVSNKTIAKELESLISLLEGAKSNKDLEKLVKAYESKLQGLTVEDLTKARDIFAGSEASLSSKGATFKSQRTKTTKFIQESLGSTLPPDKVSALSTILQLGHNTGVYSFKLVDELRILGRAQQVQTSKVDTSLVASIQKFKRVEFLVARLVDISKTQDLIDVFGYDVTNSNHLAQLLDSVFNGNISEQQLFEKIKALDAENKIVSKTANDYIEYIQFKGKFQLFSTLEKNATKGSVSVSLSIENILDNAIKGNVISALTRAGNTVLLQNIKKYMKEADYRKFSSEFSKIAYADKEIVNILVKLVSSKTFKQLVVDRVAGAILKERIPDYKQKKDLAIDTSIVPTKVKVDNSKVKQAQNKLKSTLTSSTSIRQPALRTSRGQFTSLTKLENLIRSMLLSTIQKNMERPNLRNQTGRFAESIKLDRLQRERDGAITAFLSYMKYPYATFEKGGKQGFRGYYPSRLIDQSVRELAKELVTARMKTVIV
jgi:hypothetical protein